MMLDHVGRPDEASRLRDAIDKTLRDDNVRTGDLGGKANTMQFADAVIKRLG